MDTSQSYGDGNGPGAWHSWRAEKGHDEERVAALKKEPNGLYNVGALPQAIYGQQTFGMSKQGITQLRRQAGRVAGGSAGG
eukprot:6825320-Pyramimonas_sp.AAC.1